MAEPPVEEPEPSAPSGAGTRGGQARTRSRTPANKPIIPLIILGIIGVMAVGMLIAMFVGV